VRRTALITLLLVVTAVMAQAQETDEPLWSFEGVLPMSFEIHDPVPPSSYTVEGHVFTTEQIQASMDLRIGDSVVLIRAGEVVGKAKVGSIVGRIMDSARSRRVLHMTLADLTEGLTVSELPRGAEVLASGEYDLMVITNKPVEVLAPDPSFQDITWGTQDYVVRVGRKRYAIMRENSPRGDGYRGWQVSRINTEGNTNRMTADYTWWQR